MRVLLIATISTVLSLTSMDCASTNGTEKIQRREMEGTAQADSSTTVYYEEMFYELHADLIERIDILESEEETRANTVEADAIVRAAEDLYLRGNLMEALKLLMKATKILEQTN